MPAPATTGTLKTRVSDMEIGDYIPVCYQPIQKIFLYMGDDSRTEIPVTGVGDYTVGKMYLIKVAPGLLISDRVYKHSISWDQLNADKHIQGFPWNSGNIIPTMTSNTSPSGVASASDIYQNYQPWQAFDKRTGTNYSWLSNLNVLPVWLAYQFSDKKTVSTYSIIPYNTATSPKTWTFEGSNDGVNWTVIDRQINITNWGANQKRMFGFVNKDSYSMYRINISDTNNGDNVGIQELEMYETAGTIRSLTGGVAYRADEADNGYSTTDKGLGATPADNEWDSLIVNFPQELIQPGKTLDDVFHWNGVFTWCQDTPMNGVSTVNGAAVNTWRVYRGNKSVQQLQMYLSNYTHSTLGFRPVFQYHEEV